MMLGEKMFFLFLLYLPFASLAVENVRVTSYYGKAGTFDVTPCQLMIRFIKGDRDDEEMMHILIKKERFGRRKKLLKKTFTKVRRLPHEQRILANTYKYNEFGLTSDFLVEVFYADSSLETPVSYQLKKISKPPLQRKTKTEILFACRGLDEKAQGLGQIL